MKSMTFSGKYNKEISLNSHKFLESGATSCIEYNYNYKPRFVCPQSCCIDIEVDVPWHFWKITEKAEVNKTDFDNLMNQNNVDFFLFLQHWGYCWLGFLMVNIYASITSMMEVANLVDLKKPSKVLE